MKHSRQSNFYPGEVIWHTKWISNHAWNFATELIYCHFISALTLKIQNIGSKRQCAHEKSLCKKRVSIASSWSNRKDSNCCTQIKEKKEKLVWSWDVRIALNSFFFTQFDRNFCRVKTYTRSADKQLRDLRPFFCKVDPLKNYQIWSLKKRKRKNNWTKKKVNKKSRSGKKITESEKKERKKYSKW